MKFLLRISAIVAVPVAFILAVTTLSGQSQAQAQITLTPVDTPPPLVVNSNGNPFVCSKPKRTAEPFPLLILSGGEWLACVPVHEAIASPTRIVVPTVTSTPRPTVIICKVVADGTVLAQTLNVRGGPSVNFAILRTVKVGASLLIAERSGDWARLCNGNEWVAVRASGVELVKVTNR